MAKALDNNHENSEFELQSGYYVHFWSYTLREMYEQPLHPMLWVKYHQLVFFLH